MYNEENALDPRLEQELDAIRREDLDPAVVTAASARVWARLGRVTTCADFQALIPDFRAGRLPEARRMLLEDHVHQCVACRKVFTHEDRQKVIEMKPARRWFSPPVMRWAMAASVAVIAGATIWTVLNKPASSTYTLAATEGAAYQVSGAEMKAVAANASLPGSSELRTAKGGWATVQLADGSKVELRERTGFTVMASGNSLTINLAQGSIIVQAAKRSSGNLFVATRDLKVAVTGTVFSVNAGVKGSRVAVVEGEVQVTRANEKKVLKPGEQFASDPSMGPVTVAQEISWSKNLEKHLAMLKEVQALEKGLRELRSPALRFSSRLIDRLPATTAVFVSIPNLADAITQVEGILRQRAAESEAMGKMLAAGRVEEQLAQLRAVSEYLGDEIVFFCALGPGGRMMPPVMLAEAKREGLGEHLVRKFRLPLRMLDGNVVAASPYPQVLELLTAGFAGTPFHARIQQVYKDGAGIVLGADLTAFCNTAPSGCQGEMAQLSNVVFEQKEISGKGGARVTVSFRGQRQGMAAWLGAPAALRVLDFVSPDTSMTAAFSVVNAVTAFEDLLERYPDIKKVLAPVESLTGVNLRNDLAVSLGGEILVAMDGPALPVPSWKVVAEVYDPVKLQWTVERFLEAYNRLSGKKAELKKETVNGRLYYTLTSEELSTLAAHYTFVDGYLLVAANRNLIDKALQYRQAGYTLARSQGFQEMLPHDEQAGYSAILYHNMAPALGPLVEQFGDAVSPDLKKKLQGLGADSKPALVAAYAASDRISLASSGGLLQLGLSNLGMADLLGQPSKGTKRAKPAYR